MVLLAITLGRERGNNKVNNQDQPITVTLTYQNIIYHKQITQIKTYQLPNNAVQVTHLLIAEVKCDILK